MSSMERQEKANHQEYNYFTTKDMPSLFQRNVFWARGVDVGHHTGSPGWVEKYSRDHILGARNKILAAKTKGETHDLHTVLSQYMIQEEREGAIYRTYMDEENILKAFQVWHERGLQEKTTGYHFHGLDRLNGCIGDVINRIFIGPENDFFTPDFHECKKQIEEMQKWWINERKFLESKPLFEYLLDAVAHVSQMNSNTDDCADIVMHLTALYSHAYDVQEAIDKNRAKGAG